MASQLRERARKIIKEGEGSITHMYLDGEGNVTIGVGNLLRDVTSAQALPFVIQVSGEVATDDDIAEDFDSVTGAEPGGIASHYAQFCRLELEEDNIDQLLYVRIDEFVSGLRRDFEGYDEFPESAKLGLIDMAFNLGNNGLTTKFPTFTKAAREKQWDICADECRRKQIQDSRNQEVRQLFLDCCEDS